MRKRFLSVHGGWHGRCGGASTPSPHQHGAVLIDGKVLDLGELVFEVPQERVVERKLALEGTVGHPAVLLEHCNRLAQDIIERHGGSPACGIAPPGASLVVI